MHLRQRRKKFRRSRSLSLSLSLPLSLSLGIDVQILQIILATDESPLAVLSAPRAPRYGLCR